MTCVATRSSRDSSESIRAVQRSIAVIPFLDVEHARRHRVVGADVIVDRFLQVDTVEPVGEHLVGGLAVTAQVSRALTIAMTSFRRSYA